ncbi:hypothetical protein FZC66_14700 [Priestia megaterium]|nr:hypothetical protein FZC66_14700 [Priestia megaterium]
MKIDEALERIEQLYSHLQDGCFQYIDTIVSDEAELEVSVIEELCSLLNYLYELDVHDEALVCSILSKLEYGQPIYQFAMLKPISLEGNEEKIDVLYEERIKVEKTLLDVYHAQRKRALQKATAPLKQIRHELQALLYVCSVE